VTGLMVIVRMAEIVAGAAVVRVAAGATVDAAGAVDVRAAVVGIADAAGLVGGDTRTFATDLHGFSRIRKEPRRESWPFCVRRMTIGAG
jgi:hypothetical protein